MVSRFSFQSCLQSFRIDEKAAVFCRRHCVIADKCVIEGGDAVKPAVIDNLEDALVRIHQKGCGFFNPLDVDVSFAGHAQPAFEIVRKIVAVQSNVYGDVMYADILCKMFSDIVHGMQKGCA